MMWSLQYFCVYLFVLIWFELVCEATIISDPPVDNTTCYGGIATFTCGSDRGSDVAAIQWLIDSEDINDINTTERGISVPHTVITDDYATTTITIVGLQDNHDINVGCQIITMSFDNDVEVAILTVIDIPPVTDLTIEFTGSIMNTIWQTPTILPVNYHYQINITSNDEPLVTDSTLDTVYTLNITSCINTNYTVSVSVVDTGYTQLHSEITTTAAEYNIYEKLGLSFMDNENATSVSFVGNDAYITVDCQAHELTCLGGYPEFVEQIESIVPEVTFNETVIDDIVESCKSRKYFTFGPYTQHFFGNLTVMPMDVNKESNHTFNNISTFNVQKFTMTPMPDTSVQLTCVFALNSSANGCNVTLNISSRPELVSVFMPKTDIDETEAVVAMTTYTGIPDNDTVLVNVSDVVNDSTLVLAIKNKDYTVNYPTMSKIEATTTTTLATIGVHQSSTETTTSINSSTSNSPSVNPTEDIANTLGITVTVSGIAGAVGFIILLLIIVALSIVIIMKNSRHRKQVTLSGENALVRLNRAEQHDYSDATQLRKTEEGVYHELPSVFISGASSISNAVRDVPSRTANTMSHNSSTCDPPPAYENTSNLLKQLEAMDDDISVAKEEETTIDHEEVTSSPVEEDIQCDTDPVNDDNYSINDQHTATVSIEATTDTSDEGLIVMATVPPLPVKNGPLFTVPTGPKLTPSQYATVGFTPNTIVNGVSTRPLPPAPQPESQYATIVKVKSKVTVSVESPTHITGLKMTEQSDDDDCDNVGAAHNLYNTTPEPSTTMAVDEESVQLKNPNYISPYFSSAFQLGVVLNNDCPFQEMLTSTDTNEPSQFDKQPKVDRCEKAFNPSKSQVVFQPPPNRSSIVEEEKYKPDIFSELIIFSSDPTPQYIVDDKPGDQEVIAETENLEIIKTTSSSKIGLLKKILTCVDYEILNMFYFGKAKNQLASTIISPAYNFVLQIIANYNQGILEWFSGGLREGFKAFLPQCVQCYRTVGIHGETDA